MSRYNQYSEIKKPTRYCELSLQVFIIVDKNILHKFYEQDMWDFMKC